MERLAQPAFREDRLLEKPDLLLEAAQHRRIRLDSALSVLQKPKPVNLRVLEALDIERP